VKVEFDLLTDLSLEEVYAFFRTPHDWPRLFTAFGHNTPEKNRWVKVPIARSPFALRARISTAVPHETVTWDLRGFWRGRGEIRLEPIPGGTRITGYEKVSPPRLLGWGGILERWAGPRFAAIWESGWRQIRRR
jgi:hypothetical protein